MFCSSQPVSFLLPWSGLFLGGVFRGWGGDAILKFWGFFPNILSDISLLVYRNATKGFLFWLRADKPD